MMLRGLAIISSLSLSFIIASAAFAKTPAGTVTIDKNGCTFSVLVHLDNPVPVVGWKVKEFNAVNWNDGKTLFKGSGPTDASGDMVLGPFTAPEGHYLVAVDDNDVKPDDSSIRVDFFLSCPTGSEAPGASESPSDTPTGSELPGAGSPPPSGSEEGITGTPRARVTPPATDGSAVVVQEAGSNVWLPLILALGGLIGLASLLRPRRARRR